MRVKSAWLFFLTVMFVASSADAGSPGRCDQYAKEALAQLRYAQEMKLPISGPEWSDNYQLHYTWCLGQAENNLVQGSSLRQTVIDRAKKTASPAASDVISSIPIATVPIQIQKPVGAGAGSQKNLACSRYAEESVRQNQMNAQLGAGLNGPAWSNDFQAHYNWCIQGNNLATTPLHLANREKALQEFAVKSGKEAAKRYATESVRQNQESISMGTGFTPPVWSNDFNAHYNWSSQGNNINTTPGYLSSREKVLQEFAIQHNKGPIQKMQEVKIATIGKIPSIPNLGAIAAAVKQKNKSVTLAKQDTLRQAIGVKNGGKLEVSTSTSFSIAPGTLESAYLIDIPEPGLYKIHLNLNKTSPGYSVSPRIDKSEGYSYQLQAGSKIIPSKTMPNKTLDPATFEKKSSGTFQPWIVSDSSISTFSAAPADFYFWVDKESLPPDGKLQFRLEVTAIAKNSVSGSKGEIGDTGFTAATPTALKNHPPVTGSFNVEYAVPYKATLADQFDINGSSVPYSILSLPSVMQSGMAFSVIESPVLSLANDQGSYEPPLLTYFVANAERLSSQEAPVTNSGAAPKDFYQKAVNPNAWIYKEVLSKEYGQTEDCFSIALNGASVCSRAKDVRYYSWDMPAQGYNGSRLLDVSKPPLGSYAAVVSNNPVSAQITSLELLTTRGILKDARLIAGDDLRNEVVVATRNAAPMKWTYVAELIKIAVSDQAETNKDADDVDFGEFSLLTTSILSEPLGENHIELAPDQIHSRSMPFPIVDNEDRPHNFGMRPLGNKGGDPVNNAGATTYPKLPVFVMDYDTLNQYDRLVLNLVMTEHDKLTFWQENGAVIKAFSNFLATLGATAVSGVDAKGLATSIYDFAKTDLNPNPKVHDFMGNAAIVLYKGADSDKDAASDFGLKGDSAASFSVVGPADSACFDMTSDNNNGHEAEVSTSKNCSNQRNISAVIGLRRVPQLNSWADIQIISYTPVDDAVYPFLPGAPNYTRI